MNRKDIISKLMNEGFSEKTLASLNDKQLKVLSDRILNEQSVTPSTLNIPKTDQNSIKNAQQQKQTFVTYEGEMKEEETKDDGIIMKRLTHKIKSNVSKGKSVENYISLIKRMNDGKVPSHIQKLMKNKPEAVNENVKKWVNKITESNMYPSTSKNEIMKLIESKIMEQQVAPARPKTAPEPDVAEPETPVQDPNQDPDDPFRSPIPGIKTAPKAKTPQELSAREAQTKIIELLKKYLG